jgi:hypothetical protein
MRCSRPRPAATCFPSRSSPGDDGGLFWGRVHGSLVSCSCLWVGPIQTPAGVCMVGEGIR